MRAAFDRIAPRYDLFNDLLSAGVHRRWRRRAIDALAPVPGERYLDLCAGTLDLARGIARRAPEARVAAADFSLPMLRHGRSKLAGDGGSGRSIHVVAGDAQAIPFPDATFAGCIIGFGLRNLADPARGLAEIGRVLAPGGRLVVLEFTTPPNAAFRAVYHAYFHHLLPRAGAVVSGEPEAARYLPESVARFPHAPALAALLAEAGFARVRWSLLTAGIAAIHVGVR